MKKLIVTIFTLFLCLQPHAQENGPTYPSPSFSSPRETMNFFLKTMKGHKTGDKNAIDLAVRALNTSELDPATKNDSAKLLARRLTSTLDRIEYIDVQDIPDELATGQDEWVYRKRTVEIEDEFKSVVIAIGKDQEGLWKFTPETLATISFYERALSKREVADGVTELKDWKSEFKDKMPVWTGQRSFLLLNGQWVGLFILILVAFTLEKIIGLLIGLTTQRWLARSQVEFNQKSRTQFIRPVGVFFFALFWNTGIAWLEFNDSTYALFYRAGIVVLTISLVLTAINIVNVLTLYFTQVAYDTSNKLDDLLVPLLSKTAKFFVWCVGIVMIGDSLTFDMKSIIAGMGIGGIAFALAAKDTVSNFFGSLTVILDRPFSIGDWVVINGNVEGIVETVGLRSTRIRTFYDSLVTVPNGQLTNVHIDNYGLRTYRRFSTTISVQYDTPTEKLEAFCEGVRQIILKHKWTRKDNFHVYFNNFNSSSLDILLYVFWKVPDWASELQEKHRLLLDILRMGNQMGIRFAFPTQTLHMYSEEHKDYPSSPPKEKLYQSSEELAAYLAANQLTTSQNRSSERDGQLPADNFSL